MRLVLDDWRLSSFNGWGVYGINLALEFAKRPDIEAMTSQPIIHYQIMLDKLRWKAIVPFVLRSGSIRADKDSIHIQALGNSPTSDPNDKHVYLDSSSPLIGAIYFEEMLTSSYIEVLKRFDVIIVGSTWNKEILLSHGMTNVQLLSLGVDHSLFHPAPRLGLYPGRFLIFSGGKAELRKGQDIVVKAFRIFARRFPEAILVTAWHSPWPGLRRDMDLDLTEFDDRVIDVGQVPNGHMAPIYRECHVGLFPNRREGATNQVAMEAIACGLPCIISANTGHLDLINLSSKSTYSIKTNESGESNIDEIIDALEQAFTNGLSTGPTALPGWDHTANGLISAARTIA